MRKFEQKQKKQLFKIRKMKEIFKSNMSAQQKSFRNKALGVGVIVGVAAAAFMPAQYNPVIYLNSFVERLKLRG